MPQMSPLSWMTLFFFFTMTMILILTLNYYTFSYNNKFELSKKESTINWKW